jgi:hypothetical protein
VWRVCHSFVARPSVASVAYFVILFRERGDESRAGVTPIVHVRAHVLQTQRSPANVLHIRILSVELQCGHSTERVRVLSIVIRISAYRAAADSSVWLPTKAPMTGRLAAQPYVF